jgi:hypothetical protein
MPVEKDIYDIRQIKDTGIIVRYDGDIGKLLLRVESSR